MSSAIIAMLTLMLASGTARGGDAAWAGRRPTILTLVVNQVAYGEALVLLTDGDALVVDSDLRRAGVTIGGATTQTVRDRRFVSLRSLGIRFATDEAAMTIRLEVAADLLASTEIALGRGGAPPGTIYRGDTSAYVNYAVHAARDVDLDPSSPTIADGFGEVGVRTYGALIHSTVSATLEGPPVRGLSSVTLDDRDDVRRLIAGDRLANGGGLGGAAVIGGLHVARGFDLDPYLSTTPALALRGAVLVPTTADIYVDGALVRQVTLPPGGYDLTDVPATSGAGTTRIVLRDPLGNTQELEQSFYQPAGLLRPGLSDYELSVGFRRDELATTSFSYGGPVALGRYRRGLGDHVTAGGRAEGSPHLASGGVEVRTGSRLGQLELGAAGSIDRGRAGAAGSLAWAYVGQRGSESLMMRATSARYATLAIDGDQDRVSFEARLAASRPLARRLSVGAQLASAVHRDRGWSRTATVTCARSTASGVTVTTAAGVADDARDGRSWYASASLAFRVGSRSRASVGHRQVGADARDRIELHRTIPSGRGVGYRITAEHGERDEASGELDVLTSVNRIHAGYLWRDDGGRADASVAGGVVLIGGHGFATPPVDRSFVLVQVPGAAHVRVYLDNKTVGRTDRDGDLLVTGALPNYANRIEIEAADLPADRAPALTSRLLAPPDHGGVVVGFAAPRLQVVRGRVEVERAGATLLPAFGELAIGAPPTFEDPDSAQWTSPLGSDGEFEITGLPTGSYPATIWWDGGRCDLTLAVPAQAGPVTTLPVARCREVTP